VLDNGEMLIEPTIAEYAIAGALVIGRAEIPKSLSNQEPPLRELPGYFVVDTGSGWFRDGLERAQWLAELRARGLSEVPDLSPPSRFD
jgi:hypothetical protein